MTVTVLTGSTMIDDTLDESYLRQFVVNLFGNKIRDQTEFAYDNLKAIHQKIPYSYLDSPSSLFSILHVQV